MLTQNSQLRSAFKSCNTSSNNITFSKVEVGFKAFKPVKIEAPQLEMQRQTHCTNESRLSIQFHYPQIHNSLDAMKLPDQQSDKSVVKKLVPIRLVKSNQCEDDQCLEMMPPSPRTPAAKRKLRRSTLGQKLEESMK